MTPAVESQVEDERRRLEECVQEPIRAPGSIQPHGAMLTVEPASLTIVHASDNCAAILGVDARMLLGRPLREFAGQSWVDDNLAALSGAQPARNPVQFSNDGRRFETIVHNGGALTIIEFEPLLDDTDDRSAVAVYGAMHRLARLRTHQGLWQATARELCELTEFERVTIYSFHSDGHGEIVAEELPDGMEPYLGLHFPASDIPSQARQLYLTKLSRLIVDNSGATSALLALPADDGGEPPALDLSDAELRSVSPHHLQFMRNMGQASTLSLSLVREGRLMGMITLAHRTPHRVSYLLRQGLEVLANQVALQLSSMDEIDRLTGQVHARSIRAQLVDQTGVRESTDASELAAALFDGDLTVLNLIPASGAVLSLDGTLSTVGTVPSSVGIALLAAWAREHVPTGSYVTESLAADHPGLAAQLDGVTGLLFAPLPTADDFIAWFRPEITEDVKWLGAQTSDNRVTPLSPRTSFSSWTQSVSGKSQSWNGLEAEAEELSRDLAGAMVRHAEAKLAALALRDALTGLPNRRHLMDRLGRALAANSATTLLFIDLDAFKDINDTHGHETGDAVLVHAAQRIMQSVRTDDTAVRLGGDEFVVLCENTTTDEAGTLARRIVDAVRRPIAVHGALLTVTASIGIANAAEALSAEDLLKGADLAMYRAKRAGRDRVSH
jgi:chemotaxis family two-component system sensor kinase Cph1